MQIHVVAAGQSPAEVARRYGVSADRIVELNGIRAGRSLVTGEALVIPIAGTTYIVRPGDSLYIIGRRTGVPAQRLATANRIPLARPLQVGQRLTIPPRPRRGVEANAYAEPFGTVVPEALEAAAREAAPNLTYLAPFSYRLRRDGTLQAPPLGELPAIARQAGTALMLAVTNIEQGRFSGDLAHAILIDEAVQNRLLDNIVATARAQGFRDVHFDWEFLRPEDRERYNAFLRRAVARLRPAGLFVSTALAPKTSRAQTGQWYEAHDYPAHGRIVDFVIPMTYEWGFSGGPPRAVSPIGPVRQVLEYAVREMPRSKVMMGQNLYGYDWTLPFRRGGPPARVVSPVEAVELAGREGVAIDYDEREQAPFFRYTDNAGRQHEVWFEDARSIQAKFDLLRELGLRGISYWRLGISFPQNWALLRDNFTITKR